MSGDHYEFPTPPVHAAAVALRDALENTQRPSGESVAGDEKPESGADPCKGLAGDDPSGEMHRPSPETPDLDLIAWLHDEGLHDDFPELSEEQDHITIRAAMDVWVDKRFRAMRSLQERIAENEAIRQRQLQEIDDFWAGENASMERQLAYLSAHLTAVARAYPYHKNTKTRKLPHGDIGKRHEGPKLVVVDKEAALVFAKENVPDAVEDVPTLRKSAFNLWWVSKGEPADIPGCVKVPESDTPFARVK